MKAWLLVLVLAMQQQGVSDFEKLQRERAQAMGWGSNVAMITIQAVHFDDGSPAKGTIACNGSWYKYDDKETPAELWLPFETDSRGAIIMNPGVEDFTEDPMVCQAVDIHEHKGAAQTFMPNAKMIIQVR